MHAHTTGATNFANLRADYEEENEGEEPSHLKFFTLTHKKDGTFVKDTASQEFVDKANTMVVEKVSDSSNLATITEIENEVFADLIYGGDVPKRPVGCGIGVNQGDVFGVNAIFKKKGSYSGVRTQLDMENMKVVINTMKKTNDSLVKRYEELTQAVSAISAQTAQVLEALRSKTPSNDLVDAAQSALRFAGLQVPDSSSGNRQNSGLGNLSPLNLLDDPAGV